MVEAGRGGSFFREILLQNLTRFVASREGFEWIGGGGVSKSLEELHHQWCGFLIVFQPRLIL